MLVLIAQTAIPSEFYRITHLVGLMLLFMGLGAMYLGTKGDGGRRSAMGFALHGLGVVAMLVAGFGLLPSKGVSWPWPGWVWIKVSVWLVLALLPLLVKRKLLPVGLVWVVALGLGGVAAWAVTYLA